MKAFLNRREFAVLGETFDGCYIFAVGLDGEHGAGLDGYSVEQDGACAAGRGIAADVGAGETRIVADEVDEEQARLNVGGVGGAIDVDGDL